MAEHIHAGGGACGCPEYRSLSRRNFLSISAGATVAAAALPAWMPRVSLAQSFRGTQRDVMISVFLRGAADGLSMCVPHGEDAYYTARPTLAIPRPVAGPPDAARAVDLDGFFGLNPRMSSLFEAYDDDNLLVIHATGSTDPSRSHFDAQRYMEVGKAQDLSLRTGWLGRHLQTVSPMVPGALLRGVGINAGLQVTLQGAPQTLPISNLDTFGLSGSGSTIAARQASLVAMHNATDEPLRSLGVTTVNTIDLLNTINFTTYVPGGNAVYPAGNFGTAMKQTAALIKAQVGVEAIAIDVGGWDTHQNQGGVSGQMGNLLQPLAEGLAAFYKDMNAGTNPSAIVAVMSEFGRTVAEIGAAGVAGTDHGHGNAMFVMGTCVNGGRVLANWPGLGPGQLYENRDLQVTIDYRDILAEIVSTRLGNTNIAAVFPGFTPTNRGVLRC